METFSLFCCVSGGSKAAEALDEMTQRLRYLFLYYFYIHKAKTGRVQKSKFP